MNPAAPVSCETGPSGKPAAPAVGRWMAAALVTVLLVVMGGGFCIHRIKGRQMRREAETAILAVAEAKAAHLAKWRKEQVSYGSLLAESPFLVDALARYLADPRPVERDRLLARFRSIQVHSGYDDVLLLDEQGKVRLALRDNNGTLHQEVAQSLGAAFRDRCPKLTDLHVGTAEQGIHVDLIAPFFLVDDHASGPVAALLLRCKARTFLDPVMESWPTPSRSAETVLVRREGDAVLFLTDLRHQPDAAFKLRIPLSMDAVPAVMAVNGREGTVAGRDYRNVPVLAALKAVPESSWCVVAKEDEAEALAAWRSLSLAIIVMTASLAVVVMVMVGFFWQRARKAHYRALALEERGKREAEGKYRTLFDSSRDAIMTLEPPSWQFTAGNPATVAMFRTGDENAFVAAAPWQLSPERQPDGRGSGDKAKEMIETAMRDGSHFFEWTHRRLDGEDFAATVLLTRMELAGRAVLQATVRDITTQKRAEEEQREVLLWQQEVNRLQQSLLTPALLEDKLRSITDGIVRIFGADFCRIWLIRPGDRCAQDCPHAGANEGPHVCRHRDKCLHLLSSSGRYTHIDGQGHRRVPFGCYKIGRVASGDDHKFVINDVTTDPRVHNHEWARELGLVSFAGYQLRVPGGETLGVLALFAKNPILPLEDAMLDGISSSLALVIQQAFVEETLRTSEQRFRQIAEQSGNWIWEVAADGTFTYVSPHVRDGLGYAPEELIGRKALDFSSPDEVSRLAALFAETQAGKESFSRLEHRNIRKDGREVLLETSGSPILDAAGKLLGYRGVDRDITAQRRMEDQLRHAQKLEAVGQLASGVSHEFNNLLMGITGYAQLLLGRFGADAEAARDLTRIRELSDKGAGLSRQLLTFSRSGGAEPVALDLNSVIGNADQMLQKLLPENITLERHLGRGLGAIRGDAGQLEQVLVNLALNARDAMPTGGRLLIETADVELDAAQAQAHAGARAGRHVMLAVADTGTGMDEATKRRLFEPFFSTKEVGKGTGLGLATIHGIVKGHGGHIEVRSEPGKGSTFKIFLPRIDSPERSAEGAEATAPAPAPATATATASAPAARNSLAAILLVEDEAQVREVVRRYLEGLGYRVTTAPGPAEAKEIFRQQGGSVDLLLTDMSMPGCSGAELYRAVAPGAPRLKVLFMSAHPQDQIRHEPGLAGVAFIQKPFALTELASRVRQELGAGGGRQEHAP